MKIYYTGTKKGRQVLTWFSSDEHQTAQTKTFEFIKERNDYLEEKLSGYEQRTKTAFDDELKEFGLSVEQRKNTERESKTPDERIPYFRLSSMTAQEILGLDLSVYYVFHYSIYRDKKCAIIYNDLILAGFVAKNGGYFIENIDWHYSTDMPATIKAILVNDNGELIYQDIPIADKVKLKLVGESGFNIWAKEDSYYTGKPRRVIIETNCSTVDISDRYISVNPLNISFYGENEQDSKTFIDSFNFAYKVMKFMERKFDAPAN